MEKQPIFLEEGDQVFEAAGEDIAKRYELLKSNHAVAEKRYYPLAMEVVTGTYMGDFDYVLGLLRDCYFPTREGVGNFHDVYVDALLTAGWAKADAGDFPAAEKLCSKPSNTRKTIRYFCMIRVPRATPRFTACSPKFAKGRGRRRKLRNITARLRK